jgi:replicative DNA helicase
MTPVENLKEKEIYHFGIETALISVFMQHPETIEKAIARQLKCEHFQNSYSSYIYKCMLAVRNKEKKNSRVPHFDCTSMLNEARKINKETEERFIKNAGGLQFLNNLQENVTVSINSLDYYLDSIFQRYIRIQAFRAAKRIQELAISSEQSEPNEFIGEMNRIIEDVSRLNTDDSEIVRLGENIQELLDECKLNKGQATNGIFVSFLPRLMEVLNGIRRKELIVLFARPKTGKSGIFMNIAEDVACKQNIPVLYIDTEMCVDEQQSRVLSKMSCVNEWRILNGSFLDDDSEVIRVGKAQELLHKAPFYYVRASGLTPDGLVQVCEKFVNDHVGHFEIAPGVKKTNNCLIIYDWLKVPESSSSKREKEYQQLGDIATVLNDRVAKNLDVPMICGAQANRMGAGKDIKGNAADHAQQFLGDSDRILRFCTCLIWLRWLKQEEAEKVALLDTEQYFNQMIHVLDQRKGPKHLDGIPLHFIGERITYIEKDVVNLDKVTENNSQENKDECTEESKDIFED